MRLFHKIVVCACCVHLLGMIGLQADWNAEFDARSKKLIEHLPEYYSEDYKQIRSSFLSIREKLLRDGLLKRQIKETLPEWRLNLLRPREGVVIKKRAANYIKELFTWEVSLLLGSHGYVVPSFPIDILGKRIIVQKMEPFNFGKGDDEIPAPSVIKKVSLVDYWRSHLQAYLLGLGDLLGRNIGVNPDGKIRFFDTEASFGYQNAPWYEGSLIRSGFVMESFDWPQYRVPLDRKSAEALKAFVRECCNFEERLQVYESIRHVSIMQEDLLRRLQKVRDFDFTEGKSFKDFYVSLYEALGPGLDELNHIVAHITGTKVDHGAALIFIGQRIRKYQLPLDQRKMLSEWAYKYIGPNEF